MKNLNKRLGNRPRYYGRWLFIDLLASIAGVAGGLGAIIFRLMIAFNHWLFFNLLLPSISLFISNFNIGIVLLPALGGLVVGPIIMYFAPETRGHGVPEVMEAVALKGGKIRKRVAAIKVIVSSITIGSGGSAGREGPIAQIGASIGSLLGDLFKLSQYETRLLVVCGLASGIAGTFNAPLGGALFGMEILYRRVGLFDAVPVILASVIGAAVASLYLGLKPSFIVPKTLTFHNILELPWYFILGIVFGFISIVWVKFFYAIEDFFGKINIPDKYKFAIGGAVAGITGMLFPYYGILGVGYEGINKALAGELSWLLLPILGVLKMISTAFTIGSGGSGGIFAPSLYIGTMFGGLLGSLFQIISPEIIEEPLTYALAGMASLFAGTAQAPLTVIIMIPEMTNDYSLIPPLMVSSITSFIISWFFLKGSSIYTLKLERRGENVRIGIPTVLREIKVEEIMTKKVITVKANMTLDALELLIEETKHHGFPVIKNGKVIGVVTFKDIVKVPAKDRDKVKVGDVLSKKLIVVFPDESAEEALDKMYNNKVGRLIVVNKTNPDKLIGIVTRTDIMKAYNKAAARRLFWPH